MLTSRLATVSVIAGGITTVAGREVLARAELPPAVSQAVTIGMEAIDQRGAQLGVLRAELARIAKTQPAARALQVNLFGVGPLTSVFIWAEMGDARRFHTSDDGLRRAGVDITVYASDDHRVPGHLSRQGPGALRWALYEAANSAARPSSPDHAYYAAVRARQGAHRARLSVARKLAARSHHILRAAGDDVLAEGATPVRDHMATKVA